MINTLAERELGNIPVSIATALAIDGLYNRHPDLKPMPKLPASKAKIIYLNARTLFRNIHGAIGDNDKALAVNAKDYATTLLQEVDEIKAGRTTKIYYALDFSEQVLASGKYPAQLEIKNE